MYKLIKKRSVDRILYKLPICAESEIIIIRRTLGRFLIFPYMVLLKKNGIFSGEKLVVS